MPRQPRNDYVGAWHHVMNRGAGRRDIFRDDHDCEAFLDCISVATHATAIEVHAYCLMANHFHLLVHSGQGRLSEFLRLMAGRYARHFNDRWRSDGPIFRARGLTVEIEDDAQMVQTSRYIHLNPVTANQTRKPSTWRWSSAAAYCGRGGGPDWLHTAVIADMFSRSAGGYESYLREGVDEKTATFYKDMP